MMKLVMLLVVLILCSACNATPASEAVASPTPMDLPEATPTAELLETDTPEPTFEPGGMLSFDESGQRLGEGQTWEIAVGDLDADGDLDFIAGNAIQGGVMSEVWVNDGDGQFVAGSAMPGFAQALSLGDLDGDGDLDALVTNWWGDAPSTVWLNNGDGTFADTAQDLIAGWRSALGDVDGDGDLDAVVAILGPNVVLLNDGNGNFQDSGQQLGTGNHASVALGDVDSDGDLDFLAAGWDEAATIWINDGSGAFTAHPEPLSPGSVHVHDVALGDLDGDSDLDVILVVASTHSNQVWLNDGTGAFEDTRQQLRSPLTHGVALGDVDNDSDLDIVMAHGDRYTQSGGSVWLNDGAGNFAEADFDFSDLYNPDVALGDMDADGDLDIVFAHGETWQENGGGLPNEIWMNGLH